MSAQSSSSRSIFAILLTVLGLGLAVDAAPEQVFADSELTGPKAELAAALEAEAGGPQTMGRYIVMLEDPPLASYRGGIPGLAPTAVDKAGGKIIAGKSSVHLDVESPAALAYLAYLEREQDKMLRKLRYLAPELDARGWHYRIVSNGFAVRMHPEHAAEALRLSGIKLIYPAEKLIEEMDSTAALIGTLHAWEAAGGVEEAGLGARIATMEAGNAVRHPFFHDENMPDPPHAPSAMAYLADGSSVDLLARSEHPDALVNDKFVGFRVFADDTMTEDDLTQIANGFAVSGHGSHVAGTIGGRHGKYEIAPGIEVDMAGVAPNAWLYAYPAFGETPEMLAAFEMMAVEEIDAVNLSLGTIGWLTDGPDTHPISVAMSGAADAGVMVVGSAGNAGGNGRTSLSGGWKYSEDLLVVGNTSSTGRMGRRIETTSDDVPEPLTRILAGNSAFPITTPITGTMITRDDSGCEGSPDMAGKIVVVEYWSSDNAQVGTCTAQERVQNMADSGAQAAVLVWLDRFDVGNINARFALPMMFLGTNGGMELLNWLRDGNTIDVALGAEDLRDYNGQADYLASSSSRGPGLDWSIKPDISAPGTNIISSVLGDDNTQDDNPPSIATWPTYSGTSMSAPHITGAAGLLRSMHPDWTVPQIRSALINTSLPTVLVGVPGALEPANPTEGGPGRVNLKDAHDPRAFLHPPKASFGAVGLEEEREMEIRVESASPESITWDLSVEPRGGDVRMRVEPDSLTLGPGESMTITLHMDSDDATVTEHWGDVVLAERAAPAGIYLPALLRGAGFGDDAEEPGEIPVALAANSEDQAKFSDSGGSAASLDATSDAPDGLRHEGEDHEAELRSLRLVYYVYIDAPDLRDDVLIVDWTFGDTPDHSSYYTDVLDELGLSWSIWDMGEEGIQDKHPTYEEMYRHDLVILNANESQIGLQEAYVGQYQYQNYLLGGGSFLIAGQGTQGWWRYLTNHSANELPDTPANRATYADTWPWTWGGPSQNGGCEMCLARYFAGYTPGLTSTLSSRLLVPYPMAPDRPEMELRLARHPEAEGVFDYDLDISTGSHAKDGAAGNQYQFNSGQVLSGYVPGWENDPNTPAFEPQLAAGLGDALDPVLTMRTAELARPLWSYPVTISPTMGMTETGETLNVVGTYVAGQQHEASGIAWNAMYWGFGLEGVGADGEDTASRSRLLGDTYNFLAKNMSPSGGIVLDAGGQARLSVDLGPAADPVRFTEARIDWGDGRVERLRFDKPAGAADLALGHDYGSRIAAAERGEVKVTLIPVRGESAPVYLTIKGD